MFNGKFRIVNKSRNNLKLPKKYNKLDGKAQH